MLTPLRVAYFTRHNAFRVQHHAIAVDVSISFLFKADSYSSLCIYHTFTYSPIRQWTFGYSHRLFVIVKNAAMNMAVQVSYQLTYPEVALLTQHIFVPL